MKRLLIAATCMVTVVYMFSCSKTTAPQAGCTGPKAATDSTPLLAYAKRNGITPVADTSWLYYQVITPGTGATPTAGSKIYVRYAARLMDGTYFDSTGVDRRFSVDSLIKGWQYGLTKIKAGGRIKLLVPSALGYGCDGVYPIIPQSAPLYFDIYLDSLK